jgi:hypothetical protein
MAAGVAGAGGEQRRLEATGLADSDEDEGDRAMVERCESVRAKVENAGAGRDYCSGIGRINPCEWSFQARKSACCKEHCVRQLVAQRQRAAAIR